MLQALTLRGVATDHRPLLGGQSSEGDFQGLLSHFTILDDRCEDDTLTQRCIDMYQLSVYGNNMVDLI